MKKIVASILFLIGLSSIVGGYGLIFTDWFKIPVASIEPFNSFVIPGLILAIVVGGTHILAAVWLWGQNKFAIEATAVAGFGMVIWMFTEVYIMSNDTHPVQIAYFAFAIITLAIAFVFAGHFLNARNNGKI